MTKAEALKACLEGKKIRSTKWKPDEYIYFSKSNDCFYNQNDQLKNVNNIPHYGDYVIAVMCVDFETAWKAYEFGRKISMDGKSYWSKIGEISSLRAFSPSDIRSKWIILEDD